MQKMTYAKMKAAKPATAATIIEPWTLDAPEAGVKVAVAIGAVTFLEYVRDPVPTGVAGLVETGVTVTVL